MDIWSLNDVQRRGGAESRMVPVPKVLYRYGMDMRADHDRIGVDGGGTACRVALIWHGTRFEAEAGAANVTTDAAGAVIQIKRALANVAGQAGLSMADLHAIPAYLGLAGVVDDADAAALLEALPLTNAVVADDRMSSLRGALGLQFGAVAAIGTGSFVGRLSPEGACFVGGWGLALGDQASGAWLGRGLLAATLKAHDGLREVSPLSREILQEYGGPPGVVDFAKTAKPADYAEWAPRVISAAENGDRIALSLMQAGAAYVEQALETLNWTNAEPLCLTGGVGPQIKNYLRADIAAACIPPLGSALDGALALAAETRIGQDG